MSGIWGSFYVTNITVSNSSDGGFNWDETIIAAPGQVQSRDIEVAEGEKGRGEILLKFVDKPWLTSGPSPDDPEKDILYMTYTVFYELYNLAWLDELPALDVVSEVALIEMVRSEDGGKTWSDPIQVSPVVSVTPSPGQKERLVHGSQPIVAGDGTLYVAYWDSTTDGPWEGQAEIMVAASRNMGQTFYQRQIAARFIELDYLPRSSSFRLWGTGFPQTAIGPNDELYIAYTAYPEDKLTDSGDVFMVSSLDGGLSWASPVIVNDDVTDHLQFFPSITADPEGILHMMWGDTRDDVSELAYHIYYSTSEDQGKTWEFNSRVSDFPSNPNYAFPYGAFIGDYFSIKATADDVYMVWADSRLGEVLGTNQKIAFARKKLMPSPSIFLSPPSGPAGRDITIQGHHFQPETEIFVNVGGVLTATSFTGKDGTFTMTIFAPISGEGARDVVVSDMSGNVAAASFFTEFGFDTFKKSIESIESSLEELGKQGTGSTTPPTTTPPTTTPPADTEQPPETTEPASEEGFSWLTAILAGALVIALTALAALWYRQRSISRS